MVAAVPETVKVSAFEPSLHVWLCGNSQAGDSTVFDPEAQTRRELAEVSLAHGNARNTGKLAAYPTTWAIVGYNCDSGVSVL